MLLYLKGALSGQRQFLANENALKMMKNAFYLTLEALFVLKTCIKTAWLDGQCVYCNCLLTEVWRHEFQN